MKTELLDRVGDWNPQLYREIKGKLKLRNIATVSLAFLFQAWLVWAKTHTLDGIEVEWREVFYGLNWWLPMGASAIGVYQLSRDLCREKYRGTLNFLRLSPQPSESILLGKFIGVPLLLYFAIALAFPLHCKAALIAIEDLSIGEILLSLAKVYLVWVGIVSILYNLALLIALTPDRKQPFKALPFFSSGGALIATPIALLLIANFFPQFYSASPGGVWNWFFLPESFAYPWLLATLFAINFLIWKATNRGFCNPNTSLITELQHYQIVGCTHLWFLGFAFPELLQNSPYGGRLAWAIYLLAIPIVHLAFLYVLLVPTEQVEGEGADLKDFIAARQELQTGGLDLLALKFNIIIVLVLWMPWLTIFSYLS
ncbi:hypothetical protein [Oscillatoria sp. FACHB-1406]|uniref:hypothetical protein n=1 Tax=Oscillatoria sp. FACHB-1406 TaxID=2692846 RepID=UPI0016856854|nr:hypothetical protein [Oscillatoria sp. FACHB-1406]MBD2577726.1 hypothetical protein [Oscillatoria sp. FACHB-1406]